MSDKKAFSFKALKKTKAKPEEPTPEPTPEPSPPPEPTTLPCNSCQNEFPIDSLIKYRNKWYCRDCLEDRKAEEREKREKKEKMDFTKFREILSEELATHFTILKDELVSSIASLPVRTESEGNFTKLTELISNITSISKPEADWLPTNIEIPEEVENGLIRDKIRFALRQIPLQEFGYRAIFLIYYHLFDKYDTTEESIAKYVRILTKKQDTVKRVKPGTYALID